MQADIKLQKIIPRNGKSTFVVKETLLVYETEIVLVHSNHTQWACANLIKNMAEKSAKTIGVGTKPVPMKFFAVLEVEKTAPSCIPRYVPEATEH